MHLFAATLFWFSATATAAPQNSDPGGVPVITELPIFSDNTEGIGVGFGLGEPTGLAVAYRPDSRQTVAGMIGWGLRNSAFHFHLDYLVRMASIQPPESILQADIYAGAGPTINVHNLTQPGFGIRIPVGIDLSFQKPVDVFTEVAPVIGLAPSTTLGVNGTMGVRAWFR